MRPYKLINVTSSLVCRIMSHFQPRLIQFQQCSGLEGERLQNTWKKETFAVGIIMADDEDDDDADDDDDDKMMTMMTTTTMTMINTTTVMMITTTTMITMMMTE